MNYELDPILLKLRVNWKISRNSSFEKNNFIVKYAGYESEIAPNIRYGETPKKIMEDFQAFLSDQKFLNSKGISNSFKNAILNLQLKVRLKDKIKETLGTQDNFYPTSFSIPMMEKGEVKKYLSLHPEFFSYKVKIKNFDELDFLKEIKKHTNKKLRIDANEGFDSLSEFLRFEDAIKDFNIEFIEQPFPVHYKKEYKELKKKTIFEIIADESVEDDFHPEELCEMFHGVNIKLMKAGGILRAKELLEKAKSYGLKTMIGCMIESSVGISEALYLAHLADYLDLDGHLLISNDPYPDKLEFKEGSLKLR